jgi:hypothetical protein
MIQLLADDATVYAETVATYTFGDCAVWIELSTPLVADDVLNRLSVANYSIGLRGTTVEAYENLTVIASNQWDGSELLFLRLRHDGEQVRFGRSSDGLCWEEFASIAINPLTDVRSQVASEHKGGTPGTEGISSFDHYNVDE